VRRLDVEAHVFADERAEALEGLPEMLSATRIDAEKGLAVVWRRATDDEPVDFGKTAGSPAIA